MATKKATPISNINILPQTPSEKDREEKVGGKKYKLIKPIIIPVYLKKMMPAVATLVECNDGWFQVHDGENKKLFRLSPKLIKEISDSIKEIV